MKPMSIRKSVLCSPLYRNVYIELKSRSVFQVFLVLKIESFVSNLSLKPACKKWHILLLQQNTCIKVVPEKKYVKDGEKEARSEVYRLWARLLRNS